LSVSVINCAVLCIVFSAMIRAENPLMKKTLGDYGEYVAQCMPKYVQHVQVTHGNELEILIHPDGLLPVLSFLKNHINAQFASVSDICGMDVPTRQYRFEVQTQLPSLAFVFCLLMPIVFIFISYVLSACLQKSCRLGST